MSWVRNQAQSSSVAHIAWLTLLLSLIKAPKFNKLSGDGIKSDSGRFACHRLRNYDHSQRRRRVGPHLCESRERAAGTLRIMHRRLSSFLSMSNFSMNKGHSLSYVKACSSSLVFSFLLVAREVLLSHLANLLFFSWLMIKILDMKFFVKKRHSYA